MSAPTAICIRSKSHTFAFHSPWADARTVRPYIPIMGGLMRKMIDGASDSNACRDARPVRPLQQAMCVRSKSHTFALHSPWTDARTVRPYIPIMGELIRKMVDGASDSNACRDARPVRPLQRPCVFAQKTIHLRFIHLGRTHEPCVPTFADWPCCKKGAPCFD